MFTKPLLLADDFTPLVRFEDADIHDFTAATFFPGHGWQV